MQGRVSQVGHVGQVQLLDSGWWCRGVNQHSRSFTVTSSNRVVVIVRGLSLITHLEQGTVAGVEGGHRHGEVQAHQAQLLRLGQPRQLQISYRVDIM